MAAIVPTSYMSELAGIVGSWVSLGNQEDGDAVLVAVRGGLYRPRAPKKNRVRYVRESHQSTQWQKRKNSGPAFASP